MKFIFPKNYNYNMKLFGFISYSTAIIDVILGIIIFAIVNFLFNSINLKIYFFISIYLPILLFSIFGINRENFLSVMVYIIKYFKNRKVYLYQKEIIRIDCLKKDKFL